MKKLGMRTDTQIQADVFDELKWEPGINDEHIGISVANGVVSLTGTVRSYAEKLLAEKTARRIRGVRAIAEELQVRYDWEPKKSDSEIAKRVADILEWDPLIPRNRLDVTVEKGAVKLVGKVDWNYQRDLAVEDSAKIGGVVRIDNRIEVASPVTNFDIRHRIEQAFERQADLEAERISVEARDGKVTLTGSVSSWNKRSAAERAAWAAPGVTEIEDRLVVA